MHIEKGVGDLTGGEKLIRCVLGAQEPIARTLVSQEYGNTTLAI